MPLTKEKRLKYGEGWKLLSLKLIEERAKNHCEMCGAKRTMNNDKRGKRVTLNVAHLDHNCLNNEMFNLMVMCGKCHLNFDRKDNLRRRRRNKSNPNQLTL